MARIEKRYLGQFGTEEDAAIAYDRVARHLRIERGRWNYPDRELEPATVEDIRREQRAKFKQGTSSAYEGVTRDRGGWKASIEHEGRVLNLGLFQEEADAARRYDEAARSLKGARAKLNFGIPRGRPAAVRLRQPRERKCSVIGVVPAASGLFEAKVSSGGKLINAGRWRTEREAGLARDRGVLFVGHTRQKLNFPEEAKSQGPRSPDDLRRDALQIAQRDRGTSRYFGVKWDEKSGNWQAGVTLERYEVIGLFVKERDAAIARDRVWRFLGRDAARLNLPELTVEPASLENLRAEQEEIWGPRPQRFRGTTRVGGAWRAMIQQQYLGTFASEEEAAVIYDRVARHLGFDSKRWNFPDLELEPATVEEIRSECQAQFKSRTSSKYRGVRWDPDRSAWAATIEHEGRALALGHFTEEEDAAQHYDAAALELRGAEAVLNFAVPRGRPKKVSLPQPIQREPGFAGVNRLIHRGLFQAVVKVDGQTITAGRWRTENEAALARDRALLFVGHENAQLNIPDEAKKQGPRSPEDLRRDALRLLKLDRGSSKYFGVQWDERIKRWNAFVSLGNRRNEAIASYDLEREAAIARDRVWRYLGRDPLRLNFPALEVEPASAEQVRAERRATIKATMTSPYRGVCWSTQRSRWVASIQLDVQEYYLGSFATDEEAAVAYDRAVTQLGAPKERLNFRD